MTSTDPIADLLTRIRNAQMAKLEMLAIPASKMKIAIVNILNEEGFIRGYKCLRDGKQGLIKLALKYDSNGTGAIVEIKRLSKSSRRDYRSSKELPYVKNGFGIGIYSTSKGVVSDRTARKLGIGGEYICSVF